MKQKRIEWKGRRIKAVAALLLALTLVLSPCYLWFLGNVRADTPTFKIRKLKSSSILKDAYFDFYGIMLKSDLLYWIKSDGSPLFCIQKSATLIPDLTGEEITEEFGSSKYLNEKQYELVSLVLQSCGMIRGESVELAPGTYLAGQAAVWGITSRQQWQGTEHYRREMEKVHAHIEDWEDVSAQEILEKSQEAVDCICEVIDNYYGDESPYIPAFASKYETKAPVWEVFCLEDGSCEAVFSVDGKSEAVKNFIFELPQGWSYGWQGDEIVFRCEKAEEGLIRIAGRAKEGSILGNAMPIGLIHIVGPASYSRFQRLASEVECNTGWSCYFQLKVTKPEETGSWYLPQVQRYRHQETFTSLYGVGMKKVDSKTLEPLEGAEFQPLEYFDARQLENTRLDKQQIAAWNGWKEICEPAVTDQDGRLEHWDKREYVYEKTYCNGHPQPEISYDGNLTSYKEQLEKEAQEAWEREVEMCENLCDFHSIEGKGQEWLEEDRDITYQQFIHLVYGYSFRERKAPSGYLLPENNVVGQVFLDSLQAGGNIQGQEKPVARISSHTIAQVRASQGGKASSCNAEEKESASKADGEEKEIGAEETGKKEVGIEEKKEAETEETNIKEKIEEPTEEREEGTEEEDTEEEEGELADREKKTALKRAKQLRRENVIWLTSLIEPMEQEEPLHQVTYSFTVKNNKENPPEESTPQETPEETPPEPSEEETVPETQPEPSEEETMPETLPEETQPEPSTEETLPQETQPETQPSSHPPGGSGSRKWKVEISVPEPETDEWFLLPEDPVPQAVSRMGWIEAKYATPSIVQRNENHGKGNSSKDTLPKTGDRGIGIPVLFLLLMGSGGSLFFLIRKRRKASALLVVVFFCITWTGEIQAEESQEGKKTFYFSREEVFLGGEKVFWDEERASFSGEEFFVKEEGNQGINERIRDEAGQQYCLESCQLVEVLLPERKEWVTEKVEYLAVETEEQIPESMLFEKEDEGIERMGKGELFRSSVSSSAAYWDEGFQVALRFYDYDADTYQIQGREVPREGALDYLLEHQQVLLEAVGCGALNYWLEGIIWNGDSYWWQDTMCRDALAYGKKLVTDCVVEYSGQMVYPEARQEVWEAVYVLEVPPSLPVVLEEETKVLPEIENTFVNPPLRLPEKKSFFWGKLRTIMIYSVSLAVLLPFLIYIILLARRKKHLWINK